MMATEEEQGVTVLPEELVMEILSWVPLDFLVTFRSVSNSWHNLVMNDPAFAKLHLRRSIEAGTQSFAYLSRSSNMYKSRYDPISLYQLKPPPSMQQTSESQAPSQTELDVVSIPSQSELVGSCNGWLCLASSDKNLIILMNPFTRILRTLPEDDKTGPFPGLTLIGFGYDSTNDDYKVVRMELIPIDSEGDINAKVYCTSTKSWRKVKNKIPFSIPRHIPIQDSGIYLNGALHWRTSEDPSYSFGIISFDLKDEEFRKVVLPPSDGEPTVGRKWTIFLMVIKECLGLIRFCGDGVFEVWVMKEYGRSESWTKQFVSILHPRLDDITSVSMIGSSHIIFRWGSKGNLALHDMKTRETNLSDYSKVIIQSSITYNESLTSLRTKKRCPPREVKGQEL